MQLDPFGLYKIGNSQGMGKMANILGTAEDPFQLHKSGLFYSPWTDMQRDQKDADDLELKKALAFNSAYNG